MQKYRRIRLLSLFIAENSTKTVAQNQWKVFAKLIKEIPCVLREKSPETQEDENQKQCL